MVDHHELYEAHRAASSRHPSVMLGTDEDLSMAGHESEIDGDVTEATRPCEHRIRMVERAGTGEYHCKECGNRVINLTQPDEFARFVRYFDCTPEQRAVDERRAEEYRRSTRLGRNDPPPSGANTHQVGGSHYGLGSLQHWDLVLIFGWGYFQGQIIKYVMRYKKKNGLEDLKKARHFLDKLIESIEQEPTAVPDLPENEGWGKGRHTRS